MEEAKKAARPAQERVETPVENGRNRETEVSKRREHPHFPPQCRRRRLQNLILPHSSANKRIGGLKMIDHSLYPPGVLDVHGRERVYNANVGTVPETEVFMYSLIYFPNSGRNEIEGPETTETDIFINRYQVAGISRDQGKKKVEPRLSPRSNLDVFPSPRDRRCSG